MPITRSSNLAHKLFTYSCSTEYKLFSNFSIIFRVDYHNDYYNNNIHCSLPAMIYNVVFQGAHHTKIVFMCDVMALPGYAFQHMY